MLLTYPVIRRERFGARGIHIPTSGMVKKGNHPQMAARFSYFHVSVFFNFSWIVVSISMQLYNIYFKVCLISAEYSFFNMGCIKQSWWNVGISNGWVHIDLIHFLEDLPSMGNETRHFGRWFPGGILGWLLDGAFSRVCVRSWVTFSGWILWFMIDITWYNYT